jgi:hypothetical protein
MMMPVTMWPTEFSQLRAMQWEALKRSANSLQLLPSDFHIFGPLKEALKEYIHVGG